MRYKYIGNQIVFVPNIGEVKPDEIVITEIELNHPLFVVEKKKVEEKKKSTKKYY